MQPLENILSGKNKVKLLRFLVKHPDWQFNLTDISKKINVDKGTISRVVRDLEKDKLLEVRRRGKLLLFKLDFSKKIVKLTKKMFEIEENFK